METLLLAYLFVWVLFCGLEFMDAHTGKISSHEAKQRAGKSKGDRRELFQTFQSVENRYAGAERGWLAALIFFALWSFVQLWYVFAAIV